jgi:hypothetical protein
VKAPSDEALMAKRYPSAQARKKADEATDAIPPDEPMTVFIDAWLAVYKAAGGKIVR